MRTHRKANTTQEPNQREKSLHPQERHCSLRSQKDKQGQFPQKSSGASLMGQLSTYCMRVVTGTLQTVSSVDPHSVQRKTVAEGHVDRHAR